MSHSLENKLFPAAYDYLYDALEQPYNPGLCATMLLGCFMTCSDRGDSLSKRLDADAQHQILNRCMTFLTAPRSPRQLVQFCKSVKCHCEDARPLRTSQLLKYMAHRRARKLFRPKCGATHLDEFLKNLVVVVDRALVSSLELGPAFYKGSRPLQRFSFSDRVPRTTKPWPETSLQLVPHGPEDSIRGLIAWGNSAASPLLPLLLVFLTHVVIAINQLVMPHVVTARSLAHAVIQWVEWNYNMSQLPNRVHAPYAGERENALELLAIASDFFSQIHKKGDPVQCKCFVTGDGSGLEDDFQRLILTMFHWLDELEHPYEPFSERERQLAREVRKMLEMVANYVFAEFGGSRLQKGPASAHLAYLAVENGKVFKTHLSHPVCAAFYALLDLHAAERCAAPECTTTFTGEGRKFRRCVGCLRVSYCSIACQKAAWRHSSIPHRSVCKFMRAAAEHGLLRRSVVFDDLESFYGAYDPHMLDWPRATRTLKAVVEHVEALQRAQMSSPGWSSLYVRKWRVLNTERRLPPTGFRTEKQWISDRDNGRVGIFAG